MKFKTFRTSQLPQIEQQFNGQGQQYRVHEVQLFANEYVGIAYEEISGSGDVLIAESISDTDAMESGDYPIERILAMSLEGCGMEPSIIVVGIKKPSPISTSSIA